jgi:hypothetical protein
MAAECYWCKTGNAPGSVPQPIGNRGEPLACCKQCQVFTCGDHGERDSSLQEFKCWDCLFIKLISSAVQHTYVRTQYITQLSLWDPILLGRAKQEGGETFASYEEFKNSYPDLSPWYPLIEEIDFYNFDLLNTHSGLLRDFREDERRLLISGAFIYLAIADPATITQDNAPILYYISTFFK